MISVPFKFKPEDFVWYIEACCDDNFQLRCGRIIENLYKSTNLYYTTLHSHTLPEKCLYGSFKEALNAALKIRGMEEQI